MSTTPRAKVGAGVWRPARLAIVAVSVAAVAGAVIGLSVADEPVAPPAVAPTPPVEVAPDRPGAHVGAVTSVAFEGAAAIVSGGADGTLRTWDAATGAVTDVHDPDLGGVRHVAASADGRWVLASCERGAALRDRDGDGALSDLDVGGVAVDVGTVADPLAFVREARGDVRAWRLPGIEPLGIVARAPGPARGLAVDAARGRIVVGWGAGEVASVGLADASVAWRVDVGGAARGVWQGGEGERVLAVLGDGRWVVLAAADGSEVARGDVGGEAWGGDLGPDGIVGIIAADARVAWLVSTETRGVMAFGGHLAAVRAAAFAPEGDVLATASDDGTVRVWRASTGASVWRGEGLFRASGGATGFASQRGWLELDGRWAERRPAGATPLERDDGGLAELPEGATASAAVLGEVFVGFADGRVVRDGGPEQLGIALEDAPESAVVAFAGDPSGALVVGFADGTVGAWDPASGRGRWRARVHGAAAHLAVAGETVLVGSTLGDGLVHRASEASTPLRK